MPSAIHRIALAASLLFRDVFRRRFALVLIFVVPALFDAIVLVTTAPRAVRVTVAALREDLTDVTNEHETPLDLGVIDDGARRVDQRELSLVFLGHAAVCFLSCFLAFNLVARRREVDRRLVLAGYRTAEVLLAKLAVLGLVVVLLVCWQTALVRPWIAPRQTVLFAIGLMLGGLTYGAVGLLVGSIVKQELEGIFLIILFTNVDPGWLQNPIYFRESQSPQLIAGLPGFASTQLAVLGAFFEEHPTALLARGALYCVALLACAVLLFGVRIRPARPAWSQLAQARLHFGKVLLVFYAAWIAAFELVGRYASTLPTSDFTSAWDRAIPLVPAFIVPYQACYALPLLALWLFRDWHRFNVGLLAILLASLIAFAVYLLVPVAFPRPVLGSAWTERMLAGEFAADFSPGANKLPSLHVAIAWILLFSVWGQARRRTIDALALAAVTVVTVSTVLVKQHLVVDVLTALPLAVVAFMLARRIYWRVNASGDSPQSALAQVLSPWSWRQVSEGPSA